MVNEALHNYVNLVSGLTKTTRAKAAAGARSLLSQAGLDDVAQDASGRVSKLADEIVSASKANRELMRNLIAHEVEQVVSRLGFVRAEEVERLRAELRTLQETVGIQTPGPTAPEDIASVNAAGRKAATARTPAKKSAAKKTAGKQAVARKTAKKTADSNATGPTSPGTSGPADV